MTKLFKTLLSSIENYCKAYLVTAILLSLLILLFYILNCKLKKRKILKDKLLSLFIFSFYTVLIFDITLVSRIGKTIPNLYDFFGEWSIFDGETSMYVNPKPILNIILFLPLCFLLFFFIKKFFNKTYSNKKLLIYSTVISFSVSLFIELTQLIFSLGTFQISDLAYNTLGGLAGAVIYIIIKNFSDKDAVQIK